MNYTTLVMKAGIRNILRMKVTIIVMLSIIFVCAAGVVVTMSLLLIRPEVESAVPDVDALRGHLSLLLYSTSIVGIGITLNSVISQVLVREKARGNLAALLATPVRVTETWLGKSLAIFLPAMAVGAGLVLVTLVAINYIFFVPSVGFIVNPQMLLGSLIAVPVFYLGLVLLVQIVGLTSRPATANVIAQVFLPVIINVVIQLGVRNVMDAGSWLFMAMNLGVAVVIGALVIIMRPRLTPERIMLSG